MHIVYNSHDFPDLGKHIKKEHTDRFKPIKKMKQQKLNIYTIENENINHKNDKNLSYLTESLAYKLYIVINYDKPYDEIEDLMNSVKNKLIENKDKTDVLPNYLLKILCNYFPTRTEQLFAIEKLTKHKHFTFLIDNIAQLSSPPSKIEREQFSVDFVNNTNPIIAGEMLAERLYFDFCEGQSESQLLQDLDCLLYIYRQIINQNNDLDFEDEHIKKYSEIIPVSFINKLKTFFTTKRLVLLLIRYINEFGLIQYNNVVPYMNETFALNTLRKCLDMLLQNV